MKKHNNLFWVLIINLLFSVPSKGQADWLWGREAVAPYSHAIGEVFLDHSTAVDNFGNVYALGDFYGTLVFGNDTLASESPNGDMFLVKYDQYGNVIWVNHLKESYDGNGYASSIGLDSKDNVYITGAYDDTLTIGSDSLFGLPNVGNFYIAKYNSSGNFLWIKHGTQPSSWCTSQGNSITVDPAGNSYIIGYFSDTLMLGAYTLKTPGNTDIFIVKYDSSGNLRWVKQSTSPSLTSYSFANSIAIDSIDNIYILGNFTDTISIGGITLSSRSSIEDLFIAKYDSSGAILWGKKANENSPKSDAWPTSIAVDRPGNIYVTGAFRDTLSFGPYMLTETTLDGDVFLAKYDASGNVIWAKEGNPLPASGSNLFWEGYSIACDKNTKGGGYLVFQGQFTPLIEFQIEFGSDTFSLNTPNPSATVLLQFDSAGNTLWGKMFSEGNEDDGDGVVVNNSGFYLYIGGDLAGQSIFGPDTLPYYGNDIPFIARWGSHGEVTDAGNDFPNNAGMTVFPNPSNGLFYIKYNLQTVGKDRVTLELYNVLGEEVYSTDINTIKQLNNGILQVNLNNLPSGIYMLRLQNSNSSLMDKLVVER